MTPPGKWPISLKPRANGRNIVGQQLPGRSNSTFWNDSWVQTFHNSQHCWTLRVSSVCTPCCILLDVVACCCAKFETGETFQPTTPNISFVAWSQKRSATMLGPFAQLLQHCRGHARSLRMDYKDLWVIYSSHDTLQVPNLLGVVASVCTPLPTLTQQLPTLLAQQSWELLRPFARSLICYL